MAVITISREMGSGGKEIAEHVANQLGYGCVDKELIVEVAREAEVPESEVQRFDERVVHPFKQWLQEMFVEPWDSVVKPPQTLSFADAAGLNIMVPNTEHILNNDEYHDFLEMIMVRLWRRSNVVILGRGGQCFLADHKRVLHVRIIAPEDVRCGHVMNQYNMTFSEATELVRKSDRARAQYLLNRFQANWADPTLYNLVINTGMTTREEACHIITDAARRLTVADDA